MTEQWTAYPPTHCDVRGCVGIGEYRYVSTAPGRPAAVVMCAIHRFEQWTLSSRPATGTDTPPDDAEPDSRTATHQTISRAEWLRLEIDAAASYIARHHDSDDEIEQSQVQRRQRDLAVLQAELAMIEACGTEATLADEPHVIVSDIYVCEGWWHPNVKSGQVHDHPDQPGRSFSVDAPSL